MTINHRIRFMENNWAELTTIAVDYSSQQTAYPFSNCLAKTRSKLWKPSGCFTITSSNNLIYINDGSDKTITLTAAKYTTPALLATHIQTRLNASSSNWTVSHNSVAGEYKFLITHTGSATLRLSQTTSSTWNILGFTTSIDLVGTSFYADSQRNHTEEYAIFDLGASEKITFVSLIGELHLPFTLSSTAVVTVYADNTGIWTAPALTQVLTVTNQGVLQFLDNITDTTYRYWKISIVDNDNPLGSDGISIGQLYLGDHITITSSNISRGFTKTLVDPSDISETMTGVLYSDKKTKYNKFDNAAIGTIDKTDRATLESFYLKVGKTTPFFVSFDPTLAISSEMYELTKFVVFDNDPIFTHLIRDIFSMTLNFREVI